MKWNVATALARAGLPGLVGARGEEEGGERATAAGRSTGRNLAQRGRAEIEERIREREEREVAEIGERERLGGIERPASRRRSRRASAWSAAPGSPA